MWFPKSPAGGALGKSLGPRHHPHLLRREPGTEKTPVSPSERRPRPARLLSAPAPGCGEAGASPRGLGSGPRPRQHTQSGAAVSDGEACLPTHCRDGRRAGAGPNQAVAWRKARSCPGAGGLGRCRPPLPDKAPPQGQGGPALPWGALSVCP